MDPIRVDGELAAVETFIPAALELLATLPKPDEDQRFSGVPGLIGTLPSGVTVTLATYPAGDAILVAFRIPKGRFMEADYVSSTIEHPEFLARPGALVMLYQSTFAGWESAITSRIRY